MERRRRSVVRRAAVGGVGSMRPAVTALAMAATHRDRAGAGAPGRWATDRGEGSPRVVADM
jgi:hypothetical protein